MKKLKLLITLFTVTMMLVGCSNIQKVDEPNEPVEKTQEVVNKEAVNKEEKPSEEQATTEKIKVVDPTKYDYWVVVYDQFGTELSRTKAHYGEVVKDPNGVDVKVTTNTYFETYVDYAPAVEEQLQAEEQPEPTVDVHHTGYAYLVTDFDDAYGLIGYDTYTYDENEQSWVFNHHASCFKSMLDWASTAQIGDVIHNVTGEFTKCDQECITLQPEPDIHHKGELYWLGYKDENKIIYYSYHYDADSEAWYSYDEGEHCENYDDNSWAANLEVGDVVHVDGDNYILCDQDCVNPDPLPPQ